MNKYEFKLNGETIKWEEKSHAQIFRNFWNHFIELDADKTLETIETAGLRTSDQPEFIAKNGSRKKHVHIKDNVWIYSHLTPKAMQNTYAKFLDFWTNEAQPEVAEETEDVVETSPDAPSDEETKVEEVVEPEVQLTPQQKAAITRKRKAEAKKLAEELAAQEAQVEKPEGHQLSSEELAELEL